MSSETKRESFADRNAQFKAESPARERLMKLFDAQSFTELDAFASSDGAPCGVVAGFGYVGGNPVYAYAQDSAADGGAVNRAHAQKVKKVYEMAAKTGAPVVAIFDSNGGRIADGADTLAAYGDMLAASNNLSGVVPQIALVLGTCGMTAAVLACGMDFVIMSEEASLFTAVSDGGQGAEAAVKAGAVHIAAPDETAALEEAKKLLSVLPSNNLATGLVFEGAAQAATVVGTESGRALAQAVCDGGSLIALQTGFGDAIFTGLSTVGGSLAGLVATEKEMALDAPAMEKAARFVRFCDAFHIPLITFVDTMGTAPADDAIGDVRAMAKLANSYAEATTAKVAVISGNAFGPAYIALAGAGAANDLVMAWDHAVISALAPEAAVEFLWHDRLKGEGSLDDRRKALVTEYNETLASPFAAAQNGYVNDVITPQDTRQKLVAALDLLAGKRVSRLPKKHANNTI